MPSPSDATVEILEQYQQQHLLQWWDELTADQQNNLSEQINAVDFAQIQVVWKASQNSESATALPTADRADTAAAPKSVVLQPSSDADRDTRDTAASTGRQLLADGKVAVITVAGGQGSRLGFDHPKGMYPVGPVTDRTLFQIFAEQIAARRKLHGGDIPWLIMTSAATHTETVDFFQQQAYFGLSPQSVHFFQQGSMPAVDAATGKVLMADRAALCLSPDGHGGLVTALKSSGLLQQMSDIGVEHFFYHQVDNPTVILCDPELIGVHAKHESELTTNVVRKTDPMEKMGVLVDMEGRLEIIEYSELNQEQASRHDESGQWIFWAGNTAIHLFTTRFFERLSAGSGQLELHLAHKKVAYLNEAGTTVEPSSPNANKFERFIFDALPLAKNALIVEGDRDREFNPLKNAEGSDSPATARAALTRIGHQWLSQAGHPIDKSSPVEISPLIALDAETLAVQLESGKVSVSDFVG